jgi:hypothetical protein
MATEVRDFQEIVAFLCARRAWQDRMQAIEVPESRCFRRRLTDPGRQISR